MKKIFSGLVLLGFMISASAWAAGNDELWEISNKMEMAGMPFAMPAQTTQVCMQKGHEKDPNNAVPKDKNQDCKMSDMKVSGKKSSWNMKCEGKHSMTGSGEMIYGDGTYSGKMKMHSKDGDMDMAYEGKRIGTCNYETDSPMAKFNAQQQQGQAEQTKEQAKECKEALDENRYSKFLKPDCAWATDANSKKMCAQMSCPDLKPQMCDRIAKETGSTEGYKKIADNKEARKLAGECGFSFEKITREFCRKQLDGKNYEDLAQYCEKEARPLYDKNCAGRDYTAAMDSKYAPICRRFGKWKSHSADDEEDSGSSASDKKSPGDKKSADEKKPAGDKKSDSDNPANSILDGAKSLKGLFNF